MEETVEIVNEIIALNHEQFYDFIYSLDDTHYVDSVIRSSIANIYQVIGPKINYPEGIYVLTPSQQSRLFFALKFTPAISLTNEEMAKFDKTLLDSETGTVDFSKAPEWENLEYFVESCLQKIEGYMHYAQLPYCYMAKAQYCRSTPWEGLYYWVIDSEPESGYVYWVDENYEMYRDRRYLFALKDNPEPCPYPWTLH